MSGQSQGDELQAAIGTCEACGRVYPVEPVDDELVPIGTDGTCNCGHDAFEPLSM